MVIPHLCKQRIDTLIHICIKITKKYTKILTEIVTVDGIEERKGQEDNFFI